MVYNRTAMKGLFSRRAKETLIHSPFGSTPIASGCAFCTLRIWKIAIKILFFLFNGQGGGGSGGMTIMRVANPFIFAILDHSLWPLN